MLPRHHTGKPTPPGEPNDGTTTTIRTQPLVYVVHWNGDEDCGGKNDGPVAVHMTQHQAEDHARALAAEYAADKLWAEPTLEPYVDDAGDVFGIHITGTRTRVGVRAL